MKYHSQRTQDYLAKVNKRKKIQSFITSFLLLCIPVSVVVLIILDWLRVFRLSNVF